MSSATPTALDAPLRLALPTPSQTPDPLERAGDVAQDVSDRTLELAALPLRILLIVLVALVLRYLAFRAIGRVTHEIAEGGSPSRLRPLRDRTPAGLGDAAPLLLSERRRQRAQTVASVLRSVTSIVVLSVAGAMVLSELGLDLGPVLASAGILGVAVGFGAQTLVKDFLSGIFLILEDQYGVGDAVDVGEAVGLVEAVGLRTTRLRSVDGTVWHVRNGEILRVGNMSQGWSRALLDVPVALDTDIPEVKAIVKAVADSVWKDDEIGSKVLEEPEVWGVEGLDANGLVVRLVVKTVPLEQWAVARELRQRLKVAFDSAGIDIAVPRTVVQGAGGTTASQAAVAASASPDGAP